MRKILFVLMNFLTITVMGQTKGHFDVYDSARLNFMCITRMMHWEMLVTLWKEKMHLSLWSNLFLKIILLNLMLIWIN